MAASTRDSLDGPRECVAAGPATPPKEIRANIITRFIIRNKTLVIFPLITSYYSMLNRFSMNYDKSQFTIYNG
jgi:hypothetical protein